MSPKSHFLRLMAAAILTVPAQRGGYFVTVRFFDPPAEPADKHEGLTLYLTGIAQPIATLPKIALWDKLAPGDPEEQLSLDQRIQLIPDARLIVTLPPTNDQLGLYLFDPDAALEKSDLNYLFVASLPPAAARKGQVYAYSLSVKSNKGGLKYRLESGPESMAVSKDGEVRWDVPADWKRPDAEVLLGVADASGQECFQTFKIKVAQ